MARYVWRDGKMVEVTQATRREVDAPYVIQDSMPATEHFDGTIVDSKSVARRMTRAAGLEEVGSERLSERKAPPMKYVDEAKMRDAYEYVKAVSSDPSKMRAWREEQAANADRLTNSTGFHGSEER